MPATTDALVQASAAEAQVMERVESVEEVKTSRPTQHDYSIAIACTPLLSDCVPILFNPARSGQWTASPSMKVVGCLGGQVIDWREATLPEQGVSVVNVVNVCGNVSLYFPPTVQVQVQSCGITHCRRDRLWRGKNGAGPHVVTITGYSCCANTGIAVLEPRERVPLFLAYGHHTGNVQKLGG